jgi:hypothetical protein
LQLIEATTEIAEGKKKQVNHTDTSGYRRHLGGRELSHKGTKETCSSADPEYQTLTTSGFPNEKTEAMKKFWAKKHL